MLVRYTKKVLYGMAAVMAVLVLLVVLLLVFQDLVVLRLANQLLPKYLNTGMVIGDVGIDLFRGEAVLKEVRIDSPEGFGRGPMLVASEVRARLKLTSLLKGPITVIRGSVTDVHVNIVKNEEGRVDVLALFEGTPAEPGPVPEEGEGAPVEEESAGGLLLFLKKISIRNLTATYTDLSLPGEPRVTASAGIDCVVKRFLLDTSFGQGPAVQDEYRKLTAIEAHQGRGDLDLKNFEVFMPRINPKDPLVKIPGLHLELNLVDIHKTIEVAALSLDRPSLELIRDRKGKTNLEELIDSFSPPKPRDSGPAASPTPVSGEASGGMLITVKTFALKGFSFRYTDRSFQENPFHAVLPELDLTLTDLSLDTSFGKDPAVRERYARDVSRKPGPARVSLALKGLTVPQPHGFGKEALLRVPQMAVEGSLPPFLQGPFTVEKGRLDKPEFRLIRQAGGKQNVDVLLKGLFPSSDSGKKPGKLEKGNKETALPLSILMKDFSVNQLFFLYADSAQPGGTFEIRMKEVELQVADLLFDPARPREERLPGSVVLTARIGQKSPPDAPLGLAARAGVLGTGVPPVNAVLRVAGLELQTLAPLVPTGTAQTLGGSNIDLFVNCGLSPEVLAALFTVRAEGRAPMSMAVGGTPEKPVVDNSSLLFPVMSRFGGGVGKHVMNLGGVGMGVAGTTFDSAMMLGKGTFSMLGTAGKGVFKTLKGAATADMKELGDGLHTTTIGTVTSGAETVWNTSEGLVDGTSDAGKTGAGIAGRKRWRDESGQRWEKNWKKARTELKTMPYPGR